MTDNALSILNLRDVMLPEPVGAWPPAPFLWVLLGMAVLGSAVLLRWGVVRWRAGAYRREGLVRLRHLEMLLETDGKEIAVLREVSVLLKRVALAAYPRKQVAPLFGNDWLRFLDRTCEGCRFSNGPGNLLVFAMWTESDASLPDAGEGKALVNMVRSWIKGHHPLKIDTHIE
jgi:uncharacterized protein DUF4381